MIQAMAAGAALIRQWKLAAIALALMAAAAGQCQRLSALRALEKCRGDAALAELRAEQRQSALEALARDSAIRLEAQARLTQAARAEQARQQGAIEALRRSAKTPRSGGACAPSEALRAVEDSL